MNKLILAIIVMAVLAATGCATIDQGGVSGRVTNTNTSEGITDANVVMDRNGTTYSTTTDGDGRYDFEGMNPGSFVISTNKAGYDPSVSANIEVEAGKITERNLTLTPSSGLTVNPLNLDFGNSVSLRLLELTNSGSGSVNWSSIADAGWVAVSPNNGTVGAGQVASVVVTIDRAIMPVSSSNSATLTITSSAGNQQVVIQASNVLPNTPPQVSTGSVSGLVWNGATVAGSITDLGSGGITQHGHCWSTQPNPTLSDQYSDLGVTNAVGQFSSTLDGLDGATTYYVKAYAVNSGGTVYDGNQQTFTTPALTVTDIDGNVYQTVKIGDQIWMAENLKVTKYNNGTNMTNAFLGLNDYWNLPNFSGSYASYDHSSSNRLQYGLLYDYAASVGANIGPEAVCPIGWRIALDEDYAVLFNQLGGESVAGGLLKEPGSDHWNLPNSVGVSPSGFNARGGGFIEDIDPDISLENYIFSNLKNETCFWAPSQTQIDFGFFSSSFKLSNDTQNIEWGTPANGCSIRCIME